MDFNFNSSIQQIKLNLLNVHNEVQKRRLNDHQITCIPGCSHCCNRLISVLTSEALIIYESIKKHELWNSIHEKLKEQSEIIKKINGNQLSWYYTNTPCALLSDNKCIVYPVRPVMCSVHHVISNPKSCHSFTISDDYRPLDYNDIYNRFLEKSINSVADYGILNLRLPLQTALLFAEKIQIQSNLTFEKLISLYLNEV